MPEMCLLAKAAEQQWQVYLKIRLITFPSSHQLGELWQARPYREYDLPSRIAAFKQRAMSPCPIPEFGHLWEGDRVSTASDVSLVRLETIQDVSRAKTNSRKRLLKNRTEVVPSASSLHVDSMARSGGLLVSSITLTVYTQSALAVRSCYL